MKTKGLVYLGLAIVLFIIHSQLPVAEPGSAGMVIKLLVTVGAWLFVIASIRTFIFSAKKTDNTIPAATNKRTGIVLSIVGALLATSIYSLPALFCKSGDFICGPSFVFVGMILTAGGIIILIYGLRKLFGDRKLF